MSTIVAPGGPPTPKLSTFFYLAMAVLGLGFGVGYFGLLQGDWLTGGILLALAVGLATVAALLDYGILPGEQRRLMQEWKRRNGGQLNAATAPLLLWFTVLTVNGGALLALCGFVLLAYGAFWRFAYRQHQQPSVAEYDAYGHE